MHYAAKLYCPVITWDDVVHACDTVRTQSGERTCQASARGSAQLATRSMQVPAPMSMFSMPSSKEGA